MRAASRCMATSGRFGMPDAGSTSRTPTTASRQERATGDRAVARPPAADPARCQTGRIATSARRVDKLARATREREPDQVTRRRARVSLRPAGRLENGRFDLVLRPSFSLQRLDQHAQVFVVVWVQALICNRYLHLGSKRIL